MKIPTLFLSLTLLALSNWGAEPGRTVPDPRARPILLAQEGGAARVVDSDRYKPVPHAKAIVSYSSLDAPDAVRDQELLPAGTLSFEEADLNHVFKAYQDLSHRTLIRGGNLVGVKMSLRTETSLSRREALQVLDTALAQNGIAMVTLGTKFVKAVPSAQAYLEAAPVVELPPSLLPDSSSLLIYIVELKPGRPGLVAPALQPLAGLPNSIVAMNESGILMLRDYSANVRRMLLLLEKTEKLEWPSAQKGPH